MKKYIYLAFALLLGSWTFISCGDEEDTIVDNTEPTVTIPADDSNFPPVYVNPSEMPENGIVIAYRLYNQDGKQTTAFKQSDDIIFDIQLYNMEDTIVYVMGERDGRPTLFPTPLVEEGIQTGIFNVYTAEGKFVGYPYNAVFKGKDTFEYEYYSLLAPAKKYPDYIARWTASWSGKQYEDFMVGRKYKYYLRGVENGVLLPGEYYTEFDVNLRPTIKRKVRIDFTVTK